MHIIAQEVLQLISDPIFMFGMHPKLALDVTFGVKFTDMESVHAEK